MIRTFKYRAYINKDTESKCLEWLELCRQLYNTALEQRKDYYKTKGKYINCFDQMKQLPELRKYYPEYKNVGSQCLQGVIENVNNAFIKCYRDYKIGRKKHPYPRYKSSNRYNSFILKQNCGWKIDGKYLIINRVGRFKLRLSRPIEGRVKNLIVNRDNNKWYVLFVCDEVAPRDIPITNKEIGIDVGIKYFAVDSEGSYIDNPKYLRESLKEIRKANRKLHRRELGSNRWKDAKYGLAKIHKHVSSQRKDFLDKVSINYIVNYDKIYIEKLHPQLMALNGSLALSINDCGWSVFFNMLHYKAEGANKEVIDVNPRNTSKVCSSCGMEVIKSLAERIHKCPFCGLEMCRDVNAAINIKRFGQNQQLITCASTQSVDCELSGIDANASSAEIHEYSNIIK